MRATLALICVVVYGAISLWLSLRNKSLTTTKEGFFLGGRSIGVVTAVCSLIMGFLSGLVIVGFPAYGLRISSQFFMYAGFGTMGLIYPWFLL